MAYNPADHYWLVGAKLFSTAEAAYVEPNDAVYAAWLEAGNSASLARADELAARLVMAQLPDATVMAVALGLGGAEALKVAQARGLQLASTGTPALDGTYAIDAPAQQVIAAIYAGIKGGDGLPGGGGTFYFSDISGVPHAFTEAQFTAFAKVVRDYVYALSLAARQPTPVWPAAIATIL